MIQTESRLRRAIVPLVLGIAVIVPLPGIASGAARAESAAAVAKRATVPPLPARLADGHPNWTGFWVPLDGMLEHDIGLGGTPVSAAPPPTALTSNGPPRQSALFTDIPALKSPYKEQVAQFAANAATAQAADPFALCLPPGMPRVMRMIYGMEILQTPHVVAITSEWQAANRRVWMSRPHPSPDDLDPTYAGDSVGRWEGDTLVVDTVGIRDDVPLNSFGLAHGPKLHIVERFHQTSPGILIDDITVDDPDVFVEPWHNRQTYRHRPDLAIREYVCEENNRNVGATGEPSFIK